MEKESKSFEDDQFCDAFDEFPFFDCISNPEPNEESTQSSNQPQLDSMEGQPDKVVIEPKDSSSNQIGLRRRSKTASIDDSKDASSHSTLNSGVFEGMSHRERRNKILSALKACERSKEGDSSETTQKDESLNTNSVENVVNSHSEELENSSSSFLVFLAGLVIKAIGFQVSLLISFFSFPIWFSYCSFMFMIDPYQTLKRAKDGILERSSKVWSVFSGSFAPFVFEKLKGQKYIAKLALRFGWGFVWSVYICSVLFGFLVTGFVIGGLTMRYLVEEPIQMTEPLNFDYTKASPVALVPIIFCPSTYSGVKYQDIVVGKSTGPRVLPPNHKLQLTISLTMPESDYNRHLGVFQVRVESLSEYGEVTASSRHPCMLRFKSHLIRYLETFLKSVPLLAGYTSETQVLNIKMRGFSEGHKPTSCLRVTLEQRAEYRYGAGIPEIYAASLLLESELPFLKRILWYWRKTIFIWISMVSFTMEVMVTLLCCRPILIPRSRPRDSSTASNAPPQNNAAPVGTS